MKKPFDVLAEGLVSKKSRGDKEGKPLTGVSVSGLSPRRSRGASVETLQGDEFTVRGVNPLGPAQWLTFRHKDKNLGLYTKVLPDEKLGPWTVKLLPCGSLSARIVDQTGQPLAGFHVEVWPDRHIGGPEFITDKEGRFRAEGLVPGIVYGVGYRKPDATNLHSGSITEPGKNKDLGDIKVAD